MSLLENLRNKSEAYRHIVAGSTAFVITSVLFAVWVTVVFPSAITGKPVVAEENQSKEQPFSLFKQNTAQAYESVKNEWKSLVHYWSSTNYQADPHNQIQIVPSEKSGGNGENMGQKQVY